MAHRPIALALALGLGGPLSHASPVWIVRDGSAQGCILRAEDSPNSVKFAAIELQKHIEKISGARLPICIEDVDAVEGGSVVISLGATKFARRYKVEAGDLPADGFRIRSAGAAMVIVGKDHAGDPLGDRHGRLNRTYNKKLGISAHGETGTQFGVYEFLRSLGVRWYLPGDLGAVIPQRRDIIYDGREVEKAPYFHYRKLHAFTFDSDAEAAIWYKRVGYGSVRYVNLNHSFTDWVARFAESHPEYFAVINGQPHFEQVRDARRVILNFTAKGTLEQVISDAKQHFKANPAETLFPVVPNDSHVDVDQGESTKQFIHKPKYSTGWLSDLVWGFVNKVAAGVRSELPGKQVGGLAYGYQFDPPSLIERFEPNVVVMHCRKRLFFWDEEYRHHVSRTLRQYEKLKPAEQYIWEYYNLRARDIRLEWIPTVAPRSIVADINSLKDVSSGEFIQAEQSTATRRLVKRAYNHLNLYFTARALWDPDMDVEAALTEYFELFYGPAAEPMRYFWEGLENLWLTQPGFDHKHDSETPEESRRRRRHEWKYYWFRLYTSDRVEELFAFLKDASRVAFGHSPYEERVRLIATEFLPMREISRRLTGTYEPSRAVAERIFGEPKLDGIAVDKQWEGLRQYALYNDLFGRTEPPAHQWKIAHNGDYLFVALAANFDLDQAPSRMWNPWSETATESHDYDIEIMVATSDKQAKSVRLRLRGSESNAMLGPEMSSSDIVVKASYGVTNESGQFGLELALPLSELSIDLAKTTKYFFNLSFGPASSEAVDQRSKKNRGGRFQWAPSYGVPAPIHQLGSLTFEP